MRSHWGDRPRSGNWSRILCESVPRGEHYSGPNSYAIFKFTYGWSCSMLSGPRHCFLGGWKSSPYVGAPHWRPSFGSQRRLLGSILLLPQSSGDRARVCASHSRAGRIPRQCSHLDSQSLCLDRSGLSGSGKRSPQGHANPASIGARCNDYWYRPGPGPWSLQPAHHVGNASCRRLCHVHIHDNIAPFTGTDGPDATAPRLCDAGRLCG
mmetsp:Transcript_2362/g.5435  ORF Transcript_2362/g.5435 Transcript_2362/m.5435 type:complete len:209 (-) Transcript_2362:1174-1800(-)